MLTDYQARVGGGAGRHVSRAIVLDHDPQSEHDRPHFLLHCKLIEAMWNVNLQMLAVEPLVKDHG